MAPAKPSKLTAVILVPVLPIALVGSPDLFPAQTYTFSSPPTVAFVASLNSTSITQGHPNGESVPHYEAVR